MTAHTDILTLFLDGDKSPLLDLQHCVQGALEQYDDVLNINPQDPQRTLWGYDTVSWSIETYNDGRYTYTLPLCMSWKSAGQLSSKFRGDQPLSQRQVKRINDNITNYGLVLINSIVTRRPSTATLSFCALHDTAYYTPDRIRDNYLGKVLVWRQDQEWMRFFRLDECADLNASFTIAYRFTDLRNEKWTARFNNLKNGESRAIDCASKLMATSLSNLVSTLNINPWDTAIIPCLTSREASASPNGTLSRIARRCAEQAGLQFVDNALNKERHPSLSTARSADERRSIVAYANYRAASIDAHDIIILDDFITRGDTMSAVAHAVRRRNAHVNDVYGVAFGKNEKTEYWHRKEGLKITNKHAPEYWLTQWPLEHDT